MRRCLYLQGDPSGGVGGAVRSLLGIVGEMPARGWAPHVALGEGSALAGAFAERGAEVLPMPMAPLQWREPRRSLRQLAHWYRALGALRPDLIHENSFGQVMACAKVPSLLGIPYITHLRFPTDAEEVRRVLRVAPRPAALVFNSSALRGHFTAAFDRYAPGVPQVVLQNAVDLDEFYSAPEPAAPPYVIGMVGNFAPYKGHRAFLQMARQVYAQRRDVAFVIVGGVVSDATQEREIRALAEELGLTDVVRFLGHRADIADLMRGLHMLVHPARFEAFGRVLIEAMACGRPVVATREGGPIDIIADGETGLLVAPGDVDGFAAAILRLLDDTPLRQRMGAQATVRARQRYSLARHVSDLTAVYDAVLAQARR